MAKTDLTALVRKNILALKPYSSARDEFSSDAGVFLDANENPYGAPLNRYPDPHHSDLKKVVSSIKNVPAENVFFGNGSDEAIDLVFRVFVNPGKDKVIICPPTYGMYEVSANINDAEIITVPLTDEFELDIDEILAHRAKCLFICSPNNPTGNILKNIEMLLDRFEGIVVVDEAYIDFCPQASLLPMINKYPNLIVLQTLSKAWGMAAARVGMAFAQKAIIDLFNKTKPPYNISLPNQRVALQALDNSGEFNLRRNAILEQREIVRERLLTISYVEHVYPSDANFLLVRVTDANAVYDGLKSQGIIVRNRTSQVRNCIRITIGMAEENEALINGMKNIEL